MKTRSLIVILILVGAALAFEAWFAGLSPGRLVSRVNTNSMAQTYTQALAKGDASIGIVPDARLLASPAPFARENMSLHPIDSSFYHGRFYLYFGIVPFALLLVPWTLLTHTLVADNAAVVGLLALGHLMYGTALWIAFNTQPQRRSLVRLGMAAVVVIACSGTLPLLGRTAIYEIESAGAYACFATGVLCVVAAGRLPRSRVAGLVGSALFSALAVGCRPNYLPAVAVLGGWSVLQAWSGPREGRARTAALVVFPIAAVGLGLAFWNYARFSNPLEFGLSYIFFQHSQPAYSEPSAGNLLYNAHRYLVGGWRLGSSFPFIEGSRPGPIALPPHHEEMGQVYGFLLVSPVLAWAAVSVWLERGLGVARRESTILALAAFLNFALVCSIGFGSYRYPVDFLGILSFVAAMGLLRLPARTGAEPWLALSFLAPLALAWSVVLGFFQMVSIARTTSLFDEARPGDFARMARPFDRIAYAAENAAGIEPRYLRLNLMFPGGASGLEPLVVCGEPGGQDFVYVYYAGPASIQLGFESMGRGGPVSAYLPVDRSVPHVVEVDLGGFLPPADHPLLAAMSAGDRAAAHAFIHVTLDGRTVLDGPAGVHPVRGRIMIGESPDDGSFGRRFSGKILRVERPRVRDVGLFPDWSAGMFGPIMEEITLVPMPPGTAEPLVCAGYRRSGGVLALQHLGDGRVRLEWLDFGGQPVFSEPFAWSYERPHTVEASFGSLLPPVSSSLWGAAVPVAERQGRKRRFRCAVDGRPVWAVEVETPDASPYSVTLGENTLTLGGIADRLAGRVVSGGRGPWDPAPQGSPAPGAP